MVNITKETYENNGIEVITDNLDTLWLNEIHVQQQLGHKHLQAVMTNMNMCMTNLYNQSMFFLQA